MIKIFIKISILDNSLREDELPSAEITSAI